MSCGAKDGRAAVRACGAAGFRGQSHGDRSDDAAARATRVGGAG
jgi:hypothetical protein